MDTLPSKETFEMIQSLSYEKIVNLSNSQTRLILPCLVRMSLCDTLDVSKRWVNVRKRLKLKLLRFVEVNELRNLLDFNFGELEVEVKKEMQLRSKTLADGPTSSILLAEVAQFNGGLMKAFEAVDPKIRIKIVLSELIQLINVVRNSQGFINEPYTSELFDSEIYFFDILDLLYFSISEMPNTFQLIEVVEALLLLKKGLNMICCLIANFPESFHEICMSLITNSSNTEDESFHSANRVRVLRKLCQMNPNEALLIRGEAVELCRMPNLVVMLTLDHIKQSEVAASTTPVAKNSKKSTPMSSNTNLTNSKADVVSFITGILLSNDERVRNWFANYIKSSQRKSSSGSTSVFGNSFLDFRAVLLNRFKAVTEQVAALSESTSNTSSTESELILTEACIMLRLYCALRGAASIKYTDEETVAICRMIICRPRHGYIGVRFVSFGLCMILAFPQMVTACESESKVIDWIRWLVQEESYLGKVAGIKSSFGEMLLLIAIHFHSNQISAIGELVSSTIGIKLPVRLNDLNRIKNIFTTDIFTEQTVAAHAVKVPVTRRLNSTVSGFLPVHCIYQLLKSRAFTKNKVPIKDWIFKQIRNSVPPIHPILPQLIEAYVNSILIPNTASFHLTNEPINEADISSIFNVLVYNVSADDDEEEEDEEEESEEGDEEMDTEDDDESKDETDDEADTSAGSKSSLKSVDDENKVADVMTSQILLLYYVLLYEDVRLANMKLILSQDRKVLKYSEELISQLPIFYLVQKTRTNQSQFGVLMPPLLRLINYHYPHLCLVKDWLPTTVGVGGQRRIFDAKKNLSVRAEIAKFRKAFETGTGKSKANKSPSPTTMNDAFERLLRLPDEYLWPLASEFVPKLRILLEENIPRVLAMNAKAVWFRLNAIFPTKLWLMTVNELAAENPGHGIGKSYNVAKKWSDMVSQPLGVFDADRRVFSCPELMEILLHTLSAFLSAARIGQVHFIMEHSRNAEEEKKRDELNVTLQSLTESAAIQLLLECCLMREGANGKVKGAEEDSEGSEEDDSMDMDRRSSTAPTKMLSNLKEVQALICSQIHQCFIADVTLAKLVHFQGYRRELLPMVVAGIPSMHVCLDYIPELLDQHELEKQSFAIDLCSHLCQEYPIQRFFHVSKLCLAVAHTHLAVLPSVRRADFYMDIIPPLQRICAVFPPLIEDFVKLLVSLAQKNDSRMCSLPTVQCFNTLEAFTLSSGVKGSQPMELVEMDWTLFERKITSKLVAEEALSLTIHKAFGMLCGLGILEKVFREEVVNG